MRILIDARFYGLENTGLGRYTVNLINQIKKLDKKNTYFILLRKKYFDSLEFPKNWTKVLVEAKHYTLSEQLEIPKIISVYSPDIVHFLHFNVPLLYKGKYVVTIHDLLMHRNWGKDATTHYQLFYFIKRLGYQFIFRHAVNSASKIIVPTNFVKSEIDHYYPGNSQKVQVIYEGVDPEFAKISNPPNVLEKYNIDRPYFIYTGNAYPHKNLKRVIQAIVHLNKQSKSKVLVVIVSYRNIFVLRLKHLVEELKAEKYVKILQSVDDLELSELYKKSVAFIYASLLEGFGLPGLEAIACGTPVLASRIPVFKEVYGSSAFYFNPFSYKAISKSMYQVLNISQVKRAEVVKKSREYIKRYQWEDTARKTIDLYLK